MVMHCLSSRDQRNKLKFSSLVRTWIFLILLISCVLLQGCLGSIASHYRSVGYTNTTEPVFVPDTENLMHAPLLDSTINSLVETHHGTFLAATEKGWLLFDQTFQVLDFALFGQEYTSVAAISTPHGHWVYGAKTSEIGQSVTEHHVYRIGTPSPVYSYRCNTNHINHWLGEVVLDLNGDGHSSIAIPCWSEQLHYNITFLNLEEGNTSRVSVPFRPSWPFTSTMSNGKQSFNLMIGYPSIYYDRDIDTPSPIYRTLDTQSFNKVILSIEETSSGTYKKLYNTLENYYELPRLNDRGPYRLNSVFPGRTLLRWKLDGTLVNWWYFDMKRNFRNSLSVKFSRLHTKSKDDSNLAVLYGWGHWCQWDPCGYAIFQLGNSGDYKLIDFTIDPIDSTLVTTEDRLIASWRGRIYEYDLGTIRESVPWKKSNIPVEHIEWISEQSGLSESEIRETYVIADE